MLRDKGVSIIIPVYNSSKYLDRLFLSLKELKGNCNEIIFVDDSSEDNSVSMIESFLSTHNVNWKIYKKKHSGLNPTRQYGVSKSKYDYVMFLDADDYVGPNYVLDSLYIIEKHNNVDIVSSPIYRIDEDGNNLEILNKFPKDTKQLLNQKEALIELLKTDIIGNYYPGKLFRKTLLNIDMSNSKPFEDVRTMHNVFVKSNYVFLNDQISYYYVRHKNTLSNNGNESLLFKLDALISRYYDLLKTDIYDTEIEAAISYRIVDALIDTLQIYHFSKVKKQYKLAKKLYKRNKLSLVNKYSYIRKHRVLFYSPSLYTLLIKAKHYRSKN